MKWRAGLWAAGVWCVAGAKGGTIAVWDQQMSPK